MALKLNSSGGGSVTLDSVNTASNVTITIPATNAGSLVTANSSGNVGIGTSSPTTTLQLGDSAKASDTLLYGITATGAYKSGLVYQVSTVASGFVGYNNSGVTYSAIPTAAAGFSVSGANPIVFATNNAERLRLDASGNLIFSGTAQRITGDFSNTTVANRLMFQTSTVNGTTSIGSIPNGTSVNANFRAFGNADPTNASTFSLGVSAGEAVLLASATGTGTYLPMTFWTNNAEKMRLDTSGNLGLGVTPSAWSGGFKALQVSNASVVGQTEQAWLNNNAYYENASWRYISAAWASQYYLDGLGKHQWLIAPYGTAGNPITFTQAMTLDASGNLLVGTTTNFAAGVGESAKIQTNSNVFCYGDNNGIRFIKSDLTGGGKISANTSGTNPSGILINSFVGPTYFQINSVERMKIDTNGSVVPGATNTQTLGADGNVWSNVYTNAVTATGDIQATSYNGGQLAGLRNKIINGNMGIAQRGTAAVTTNIYGPADRWFTSSVGNTFSTTQGSFVSGETLYDTGGAQYYTTIAVTSVAAIGNYCFFAQPIEDVRLLAGQTVTVSFWAKAAAGTPSIGVSIDQNFGAGGSPSANVTGTGQAQALTTTWTKYSKTFAVPSINGKTIGTTANTSCSVFNFWLDAGSNFATRSGSIGQVSKTVSIAQVQLEIGSVATPFEQRPIGTELALCQRYYYRNTPGTATNARFGTGFNQSTTVAQTNVVFPVEMRTAPTALEQSGTAANYSIALPGNVFNACSSVPTFVIASTVTGTARFTTATAMTSGQGSAGTATAATAYLGWSAEL